jgi:multidrug efflux pump subunit AcrB
MLFRFFDRRPLLLVTLLLVASLVGVLGYLQMPRNMYPDVERPQVTVITQLPGSSAQSVAQKVSRQIEQELYALSLVRDVQSVNKNEVSIVRAEFEYEKGLDAALLDVNNALSRVRPKLPAEVQSPSVYSIGAFTSPVMVLTLSPKAGSALTLAQLRLLAENDIRAALVTQPNIANVEVFGGYEPAVRIDVNPLRLARYRISLAQFQELLAKVNRDWPLGNAQGRDGNFSLTVYGERGDVGSLRLLPLIDGVTLGDVADLSLTHADRYAAYHGNGQAGIAVSVLRAPGGSVQKAIEDAEAALPSLRARYPDVDIAVSDTQGELIATSNSNMLGALTDAIILTSLVILLFLASWRAVATALVSIPLVFLITLGVLWLTGKELNILVMTGIILALGMLVDDAVVVLENIERHLGELHEDIRTAVRKGTEEVLGPVFVGTLATAAVIVPLMFVGDFAQQLFKHLVLAVLIALFVSYFVAVTFIPLLSFYWYRHGLPQKNRVERTMAFIYGRTFAPIVNVYCAMLRFALSGGRLRRVLLLLPAFALLAFSLGTIVPLIGREAMPAMDTGFVRIHVRFGSNESLDVAEARLGNLEARLMKDPRVKRVSTVFGSEPGVISLGSGQIPAEATVNVTYVDRFNRKETSWEIEAELRRQLEVIPGISVADSFDSGATALSTVKAPVDLRLYADDWRQLPAAVVKAKAALQTVPGITSVSTTWDADGSEISVALDESKLRSLGLTPEAVYGQLPLRGAAVASLSKLATATALPVRSYFAEPYHSNPQALRLLPVQLPDGSSIPFGEIARIVSQTTVNLLTTDELQYTADILAYRATLPVSFISAKSLAAAQATLPAGTRLVDKGDTETGGQTTKRMMGGLLVGVALLFGILVPAYGSVRMAGLSVLVLPLSAIGAFWCLLAFDKALGMPATFGIILLCSIIIKNLILMVDFIQEQRGNGLSAEESALGSVKLRFRPILMTACGAIAGMLPVAMQHAVGLERLSPLADAAIGGLLIGTILSLFYLPMLYVWSGARRRAVVSTG